MNRVAISNEADFLLCILYREFLEQRKNGASRDDAATFGSCEVIQSKILPEWPTHDIDAALWELHRKGLVEAYPGNNMAMAAVLQPDGIVYMENRFKNKLQDLIQMATAGKGLFSR